MADPIQYLMANEQEQPKLGALDRLMFQQQPGFGGRVQDVWNSPTPGSLFDLLKSAYTGVRGAGRAASGGYTVQPEVPGQWSEADEFRQQQARQTMQGDAGAAAGAAILGSVPFARSAVTSRQIPSSSQQVSTNVYGPSGVEFSSLPRNVSKLFQSEQKTPDPNFAANLNTPAKLEWEYFNPPRETPFGGRQDPGNPNAGAFVTDPQGKTLADVYGRWNFDEPTNSGSYSYLPTFWAPVGEKAITPAMKGPTFQTQEAGRAYAEAVLRSGRFEPIDPAPFMAMDAKLMREQAAAAARQNFRLVDE